MGYIQGTRWEFELRIIITDTRASGYCIPYSALADKLIQCPEHLDAIACPDKNFRPLISACIYHLVDRKDQIVQPRDSNTGCR